MDTSETFLFSSPLPHLQSARFRVRKQSAFKVGFQRESSVRGREGGRARASLPVLLIALASHVGDLTIQRTVWRNGGGDWLNRRLCSSILRARVFQSIICSFCRRSFSSFPAKYDEFNENRALTCAMRIYSSRLVGIDAKTRISVCVCVQKKDGKIKIMGN